MSAERSPELEAALRRERKLPFSGWYPVLIGAGVGMVIRIIFMGGPDRAYSAMLSAFIVGAPLLVGIVTVYVAELAERREWSYYFAAGAIANMLFVLGTMAILIEGIICAIIIVPLFAIVGGLGGLAMGAVCRRTNWPRRAMVGCVAVLPLVAGSFEHRVPREFRFREQQRELHVAAPPAAVWRELVDTGDIRAEEIDAWMYRIGVPLPTSGAGDKQDGQHLRHITMGKGIHFDQVATEWVEGRRVTWKYRFQEDSFPAGALDDHVRIGGAYFDLGDTTYELHPDGAGTRLSVRMRYRVSTHFNWYAGPVADLLVGDFAARVLEFYSRRAQREQSAPPAQPTT